jgi:2-polyprenyl-6-methoxyphenol hydroxylase-like FAD-dependent oxidoreductase
MSGMPSFDTPVLVVGAGPTGLTLACDLRRHGVACRVVDGDDGPTPPQESRALAVWERTLEVFRTVGVVDQVLARAKRMRALNLSSGSRPLVRVELDLDDADTPYPFVVALPQGETERVLLERLIGLGGAVDWRTRLTDLRQDDRGVTATLAGPDGGGHEVRAGWLVGCDGASSTVRHRLGLGFEGAEYEEAFLLADVRITWAVPADEAQLLYPPGGGVLAAFPLPEPDRWRVVDATGAVTSDDPAQVVGRFVELLHAAGHPEATVSDAVWTSTFRIHRRIADRFRVGRVFVAGDAAHIHSPAGGQGMNTGIQDAHNLAWKLALVARGRGREVLLDSYDPERRPVALTVLKGTDRATRLALLPGGFARELRDRALALGGSFEFARSRVARALSELEVGYPDSPVIAEDRAGLLQTILPATGEPGLLNYVDFSTSPGAGDRAPDVALDPGPNGGPARLFDALDATLHTLLLFTGEDPDGPILDRIVAVGDLVLGRYADVIRPWLVNRGGPATSGPRGGGAVLPDPGGAAHRTYGATSPCLYLIRPDGHVGYRAQPPDVDRLRSYLERIFAG